MPATTATDFADFIIGTIDEYDAPSFTQVSQTLQRTVVLSKWLTKEKLIKEGGKEIRRSLADQLVSVAKHIGLMDEDTAVITDHLVDLNVPYRQAQTGFSIHKIVDNLMNRGKSMVVNIIKPRQQNAMIDMVNKLEVAGWSSPSSSSDKLYPYGVPYYVTKNGSGTGFTGTVATGHSTCAGINTTTHPNYRNYKDTYTDLTSEDGIRALETAFIEMDYEMPKNVDMFKKAWRLGLYCNKTTWLDLSRYLRDHNDNMGVNLGRYDGEAVFNRVPFQYVTHLNADTSQPIYMLDHAHFFPVVLAGNYLARETRQAPSQKWIFNTWIDLSYNFVCTNRKRQGVLYIA